MRINEKIKTPDASTPLNTLLAEVDMQLQRRIDILSRQMKTGRQTEITMTKQGFVCMRIEKFHPEDKLTIGKDNKVEFTAMGKEYAGNKIMTATFNDEVILLLSV